MTADTEVWPEFLEWQKLAAEELEYHYGPRKHRGGDRRITSIEKKMVKLQRILQTKPVRGWHDVMMHGVLVLRWEAPGDFSGKEFDGSIENLTSTFPADQSRGFLLRAVCLMAQREGFSPLVAGADLDLGLRVEEAA